MQARLHHHVGKAGRQWQLAHGLAGGRDPCLAIKCAEPLQKVDRLRPGCRWRKVEERELAGSATPRAAGSAQTGQIGLEDFRRVASPGAPNSAAPATGGSQCPGGAARPAERAGQWRTGRRGQFPGGSGPMSRLVSGHTLEAAVDDDAHAVDGERGFGNGGSEHDLALAHAPAGVMASSWSRDRARRRARTPAPSGRAPGKRSAVRRISFWPGRKARTEPSSCAQRAAHRTGDGYPRPAQLVGVPGRGVSTSEGASGFRSTGAAPSILQSPPVSSVADMRGCEVRAAGALNVEREGEPEIGIERALVELIEHARRRHPKAPDRP